MITKVSSLKKHVSFMKYFRNTSWLLFEKIVRMVIGLFVGVWIARYLGPEQFGLLCYAQSFVGLFAVIATLGLDRIIVRELVKDEARRAELIGTSFYLKFMGAFVVLIVLFVVINFTSNDQYTNYIIFIIASSTIFQSFNVVDFYFQAMVLSRFVVYVNIIGLFLSVILKIVFVVNEANLMSFAWIAVFDNIVLALGFVYFFFKKTDYKIENLTFKLGTAIFFLKDSWPLILGGIAVSFYMKIDQVMIKEILGSAAVGQYAIAVRLCEVWYFLPVVICTSLFPAILNAKHENDTLYQERLQSLYDLMVWLAVSIALPLTFLSDWIINIIYGYEYSQAGSILRIYAWAGIAVFLGVASSQFLNVENLLRVSMYRTIVGMIVNISLNLLLIPSYGAQGAALATLCSYFIATFLLLFFGNTRSQCILMLKSFLLIPILLKFWRRHVP